MNKTTRLRVDRRVTAEIIFLRMPDMRLVTERQPMSAMASLRVPIICNSEHNVQAKHLRCLE